jgi:hypothetical protein
MKMKKIKKGFHFNLDYNFLETIQVKKNLVLVLVLLQEKDLVHILDIEVIDLIHIHVHQEEKVQDVQNLDHVLEKEEKKEKKKEKEKKTEKEEN